jgi:diguanylate cyclase (GGDEF)-like protein/PAS domain S-box-containing protein
VSATADLSHTIASKQALRLRRFGLATFSYVLATAMIAIAWAFGALPTSTLLESAIAFVVINLGVYAAIRSGYNLRFKDPSLTRFQILAAITVLMYIVYHMEEGREVGLFACFVVFLFGIFRLNAREFVIITLYTLAAYALVINLLLYIRPTAIRHVANEWMAWLGLAGFLPCFTIIGEQINGLRLSLRENEARFRCLGEMSSDFFWETDATHRMTERRSFGPQARRASQFRRGPVAGERRWEIPYLSPDKAGWQAHQTVLDAHVPFRGFEFSRRAIDGSERHLAISGDPVFGAAGTFEGYRGVGTDITERKRAEQGLRDVAHSLRVFADNVPVMTASLDLDLRYRFANQRFGEYFGLDVADIVGKHLREFLGEAVYVEIERHYLRALQGHPVTYERICTLASGEARHLEVKILPDIGDQENVMGCFTVTTDITEHKLVEERIKHVAHHDSLTGLPNRLLFNDRLSQALAAAKRDARQFALLYFDLDRFKPVNDVLGHAAGDELLKKVAARTRKLVRESDTVARVGGDEFTVILPDAGHEEAEIVARKIVEALALAFEIGGAKQMVNIGASVGIAIYPTDARDAKALVMMADASMYQAKQAASGILSRRACVR